MSGYLGYRKVPTPTDGGGIWTINDQTKFRKDGIWPERDPYFANVTLLLHFDGANNSTTIIDSSSYNRTVNVNNNAKISTAQSKFGGSSGYLTNTDAFTISGSANFDLGVSQNLFAAESWVYFTGLNSTISVIFEKTGAQSGGAWNGTDGIQYILLIESGYLLFQWWDGSIRYISKSFNPTLNTWYHIAIAYDGSTVRLIINGTVEASQGSPTFSNVTNADTFLVGRTVSGQGMLGYVDEFRVTEGVARYTGNFTLPSIPFPNH